MSTLTRTVQPAAQPMIEVARVVVRVCGIVVFRWIVCGSAHFTRRTLHVCGVRVWAAVAWMRWYPASSAGQKENELEPTNDR